MAILATNENLLAVQNAIMQLAAGQRKVKFEYTDATGAKTATEYSNVSLPELQGLCAQMQMDLNPTPLMQSVDVEVDYG